MKDVPVRPRSLEILGRLRKTPSAVILKIAIENGHL
jgi:hypothetical protein